MVTKFLSRTLSLLITLGCVTALGADRIEFLNAAKQHKDGMPSCGVHAAKNAAGFVRDATLLAKSIPGSTNRSLRDVVKSVRPQGDPNIGNLDGSEVHSVLTRIFHVDENAVTIIDSMPQFRNARLRTQPLATLRWSDATGFPLTHAWQKLSTPGSKHVFILNTGAFSIPISSGQTVQSDAELFQHYAHNPHIGHWLTVEVRNTDGALHYRVADSLMGENAAAQDLQWMLEGLDPQEKLLALRSQTFAGKNYGFDVAINDAHHQLTDHNFRGTQQGKERNALEKLTECADNVATGNFRDHATFKARYGESLQASLARLHQSEVAEHRAAAAQLTERFGDLQVHNPEPSSITRYLINPVTGFLRATKNFFTSLFERSPEEQALVTQKAAQLAHDELMARKLQEQEQIQAQIATDAVLAKTLENQP